MRLIWNFRRGETRSSAERSTSEKRDSQTNRRPFDADDLHADL